MSLDLDTMAENILWPSYQKFVSGAGVFTKDSWKDVLLIGPGSRMDSLKFVHFLVEVEQRLKVPSRRLSQGIGSSADPFRTLGTFADHVSGLLKEKTSP